MDDLDTEEVGGALIGILIGLVVGLPILTCVVLWRLFSA